ncbi:MAG: hypothetical protein QNJ90_04855 [Planctomycetota bacterium]|nr:hypothetical protein [Planctomycetota bacterium]
MTEPLSDDRDAADADEGARKEYPELVTGRGSLRDYALKRLKASKLLQISAVIAVLCYGAIPFLVIFPDPAAPRLGFWSAAVVVLMSLASWSLLFWWYPVLERTEEALGDGERGRTIAQTLESLAIGCVLVVHVLMAFIIVRAGVAS